MAIINVKREGAPGAFTPYGGCREFITCKDHQVFVYGSAGCGKTTTCCWKMLLLALKYPGVKFLFTRKSYRSLIKSGVETFERVAREAGFEITTGPAVGNKIRKLGGTQPSEFQFPYGRRKDEDGREYEGVSRIVLASLDKVYDEMGAEYDYIYVNQPEQISESDWQFLATRANGRRGVAPYPQLFGDPNPEHERHWIKLGGYEVIDGEKVGDGTRWRLIKSTYKDNPVIWDHKNDKFTKSGEEQIGRLKQSLNSVMAERLIEGNWCSAEGLVFGDSWNRYEHLKSQDWFHKRYPGGIQPDWPRFWAIDFGFNDPFVCAFWTQLPDTGQYLRYKLIFFTNRTVVQHAQTIKSITIGEPRPQLVVADRNPQEIAILMQELGINIVQAKKGPDSRVAGVNVLIELLKKNQLLFLEDAWVEEDPRLVELKKPIGFENEAENYRWDLERKTTNELPIGVDDHEIDANKYLFTHIMAEQRKVKFVWE